MSEKIAIPNLDTLKETFKGLGTATLIAAISKENAEATLSENQQTLLDKLLACLITDKLLKKEKHIHDEHYFAMLLNDLETRLLIVKYMEHLDEQKNLAQFETLKEALEKMIDLVEQGSQAGSAVLSSMGFSLISPFLGMTAGAIVACIAPIIVTPPIALAFTMVTIGISLLVAAGFILKKKQDEGTYKEALKKINKQPPPDEISTSSKLLNFSALFAKNGIEKTLVINKKKEISLHGYCVPSPYSVVA